MAKKKTKKSEVKRLEKTAKKLTAANLALEKQVRKLNKKLVAREQEILNLQTAASQAAPIKQTTSPASADIGADDGLGIASSHRAAWKQHTYLRDRYELHLENGASKESARQLANDDLKKEYGPDSGFSEEELGAILS